MSNDRLKFRAWDDENLCWVRPKLVENESGVTVDERGYDLSQWTGLYDSEGVQIYSGDLVEVKGHYYADNWVDPYVEPIIFSEGCFEFERGADELWDMCLNGYAKVIGNRYQYPELMERPNG